MITIYLHGLGQTPADWKAVRMSADQAETSLCPDLTVLADHPVTWEKLLRSFERFCETVPAPFRLCGLSLGAVLALNYAILHPERTGALCLAAPQYRMPRMLLRVQSAVFRLMPGRAFSNMGFAKGDVLSLTESMARLDFEQDVIGICCPTLILCGEKDRANRKAAMKLAACIPNAEILLAAGAGHELNRDAPAFLAGALREQERLLLERG